MSNAPWWRGAVIYQIYPRSFQDSNGDGVGDLPGITARLEYIAGLGVDAVWVSPFFTSPMADFGYDIADFRNVDPVFGTLADFDALLRKAHALGLKVMIDQVPSHTSNEHLWFRQSRQSRDNPRADWYVWADPREDGTPPNNWLSIFGGSAWQWEPRRGQYYLHNFLAAQPDLNFHHPDVIEAVLDTLRF
jgi:alpha-glucosidase